jgi:hypothetical protein
MPSHRTFPGRVVFWQQLTTQYLLESYALDE